MSSPQVAEGNGVGSRTLNMSARRRRSAIAPGVSSQ